VDARLLLIATILASRLSAQQLSGYSPARLDRAVFAESVHSSITTQSGAAELHRIVTRTAQYSVMARADSLVVTADTVSLSEEANGVPRNIDVDAVIGARWRFVLSPSGAVDVSDAPVVPRSIADVSDIGTAMEDFFPPAPPRLGAKGSTTDTAGRKWQRLADSAGLQRYHFSGMRRITRTTNGDGVAVVSDENGSEVTNIVWDVLRGPISFSRNLVTIVTSRFAGQTVRAQVEQRIEVRRKA